MCRASERAIALIALVCAAGLAHAQPPEPTPTPTGKASQESGPPAQAALEQYLAEHGLKRLLAAHLAGQLKTADPVERARLADRLSRVQVQLFDEAKTPEQEAQWERRSQEILALMPESDTIELRLSLAKVRYRRAEAIAERHLLRLATPEERQKAEGELRQLAGVFAEIGTKSARSAESLSKREESARDEDLNAVRALRDQAYQARSAGMYFAGWSSLYVALLTGQKAACEEALVHFGWVLNAPPNRPATVDRVSEELLKFDHVARAALACALAEATRGRDDAAIRWLDLVQSSPDLSAEVGAQVWPRRMMVLAASKRWADLEFLLNRKREITGKRAAKPLPVLEARLLAVLTLEALQDPKIAPQARPLVQSLADVALADLISAGELRHVTDLVSRYGAISLPGDGFLPHYVKGLQSYEQCRAAHAQSKAPVEDPTPDGTLANKYRDAAIALRLAADASDAERFPSERSNAALTAGLALYFAGDLEAAADRLERAHLDAAQGKQGEDALWMAVVALDKAVRAGKTAQKDRMVRLATLFLQNYPRTDRAVNLLLSQSAGGAVSEDKAVEILLAIEPTSPLRERARRHAANILYSLFTRARDPATRDAPQVSAREFAASRFLGVADEVLQIERRLATEGKSEQSAEALGAAVVRLRQILDASLALPAPDTERAARALDVIDGLARSGSVDLRNVEGEIAFRRVQLALAKNDAQALTKALDRLRAAGGPYAQRVDRLMYNRAIAACNQPNPPEASLRDVVAFGSRLIDQAGADGTPASDPRVLPIANAVADAAARLWASTSDTAMRDRALDIDRKLVALEAPPAVALRRFAELAEPAGDAKGALDAWRRLMAASDPASASWLEARYHTIRLLARTDPARAREAMNQFKLLRPDFGPKPWGDRLRELDKQLGPSPSEPPR